VSRIEQLSDDELMRIIMSAKRQKQCPLSVNAATSGPQTKLRLASYYRFRWALHEAGRRDKSTYL
jgi:hypothetical protein